MTESGDSATRALALDASRSFIVQAPAGSGKTELLIQRYLTLLGRVRYPEQIVAVTFTRKATAEMRGRIVALFELAAAGAVGDSAHRELSLELARAVLRRDAELEWGLLDSPGRLRIDTVDALNRSLAAQLPVASGGLSGAAIPADVGRLYRRAARRTLELALGGGDLKEAAAVMLRAADNSADRLIAGIADALPKRDQWLGLVAGRTPDQLRVSVEAGLAELAGSHAARLTAVFGPENTLLARRLVGARHGDAADLPDPAADSQAFWNAVGQALLTASGQWRKRFSKREGFGPDAADARELAVGLIEALAPVPDAARLLKQVCDLPPAQVSAEQSERMAAATALLLHAVAELKVIFQQEHVVDYLEIALGAQEALGTIDEPSELLLALDRRIEHLLVDEFQDTSHSQYELLRMLTAGWSDGDGRTLFLVGDPMQSIYRFRNADMSLFLRAMNEGIGAVTLKPLALTRNFRSDRRIVDWVNATFAASFPVTAAESILQAPYAPFEATREASGDAGVTLHRVGQDSLEQQHGIVLRVARERARQDAEGTIAVLVRSRTHLRGLRRVLAEAGIPVRAVELDALIEQPAVQDLWALTRALLHPADRIAWLALLRSPLCGLNWTDLEQIANRAGTGEIEELLTDPTVIEDLTGEQAAARVAGLATRLAACREIRGALPLGSWLASCWERLDGPATIADASGLVAVRRYFDAVNEVAAAGDIPDVTALEQVLARPADLQGALGQGGGDTPPVEIMTIHRAKGLEFDSVILFGLEKSVRGAGSGLIYWHSLHAPGRDTHVLLSAMGGGDDALGEYLRSTDRALDEAELGRLLYVAVTRARRHLHLVGHLPADKESAPANTLMSWLIGQFSSAEFDEPEPATGDDRDSAADEWVTPTLIAMDPGAGDSPGPIAQSVDMEPVSVTEYEWASPVAAHIGTLVHQVLQRCAATRDRPEVTAPATDDRARQGYARLLRLQGVPEDDIEDATGRVCEILSRVGQDEWGRWLLSPHPEAASELEISLISGATIRNYRIDRTFVDEDGTRWIVDYKTSQHTGGSSEDFLESEVERYTAQLDGYARAIHRIDPRPIRVGLYFPLLGAFRDWRPAL